MQVAALGYMPQIYNTNTISRASMNPVAPISEDVTRSRVDFSGLVSEEAKRQNQNPLRPGETANFADILASQFAMSAQNQTRALVPATSEMMQQPAQDEAQEQNRMTQALEAYRASASMADGFYAMA